MLPDELIAGIAQNYRVEAVSIAELGQPPVAGALNLYPPLLRSCDLAGLPQALGGLSAVPAGTLVAVEIDLRFRPDRAAALLPLRTWRWLLGEAGFDILGEHQTPAPADPAQPPAGWLVQYWQDADLSGQGALNRQRRLLVCRRNALAIAPEPLAATLDAALDGAFLRAKRASHGEALRQPLIINLHQIQDHLNLRPIIELLDPAQATVLVREHAGFRPLKRAAVICDLRRMGFAPLLYRRAEDLPWRALAGRPMLSAAESTVSTDHALSRQVVELAKAAGCPTLLLQHGVWSEAFAGGPVSFGSERVLAWSDEHARSFAARDSLAAGLAMPRGVTPPARFHVTGSPKFADMLADGDPRTLALRLGAATEAFAGVTVIGTNLHWDRHGDTALFTQTLAKLIASRRDQLFVIKPHPAENFYQYEALRGENALVYDDVLALATGFHVPRLLRGVSRLASSLSSLLVDAGVLGIPVFQYETGNAIRYDGIEPIAPGELGGMFNAQGTATGLASAATLAATYAGGPNRQFYPRLAEEIAAARGNRGSHRQRQKAREQLGAFGLIETLALAPQRQSVAIGDIELLLASHLFDEAHYRQVAGDLEGIDPVEHFLTRGGWAGLDPRIAFDQRWYAAQHADVEQSGLLPVMHYIRLGVGLGYDPHILFRDSWYRARLGDSGVHIAEGLTPLGHYLAQGEAMGISCHPFFDAGFYARGLPEPVAGSLLEHFLTAPAEGMADPAASFSTAQYLALSPDVRASGTNPLLHYLKIGANERRRRSGVQNL